MVHIYTRKEVKQRRMKYQVFAGMFDFVAILVGIAVIIACIILMNALVQFILRDGAVSFAKLWG